MPPTTGLVLLRAAAGERLRATLEKLSEFGRPAGGTFADGVQQLEALLKELEGKDADKDLAAYVKFRQLTAAYGLDLQAPKADFAKIQTKWLKDLEQYVADYPTSPDAAEAMLQMAIAQEFAGQEDEAKQWYGRVVQSFANSPAAKKAKAPKAPKAAAPEKAEEAPTAQPEEAPAAPAPEKEEVKE